MNELYQRVHGGGRRAPVRRAGRRHRRRPRQRQEDLLRRRQPQEHGRRPPPDDARADLHDRARRSRPACAGSRRFPRPVVAAINGAALGGGLEIALAANHRIAVDDRSVKIGLPESTLGLLPGGGGVTRVVRMLGLQSALMDVLMPGTQFDPQGALAKGLVDELLPTREELVPAAKAWILAHRDDEEAATKPWDRAGYRMPGGTPKTPALAAVPAGLPGAAAQADQGRRLPRAARDPERRGRGRAGRLRHRVAHRVALLHRPGRQPAGPRT